MTGLAFDKNKKIQDSLEVVVSYTPCLMPDVDIVNRVTFPYYGRSVFRMLSVVEEGLSTITCNISVTTR